MNCRAEQCADASGLLLQEFTPKDMKIKGTAAYTHASPKWSRALGSRVTCLHMCIQQNHAQSAVFHRQDAPQQQLKLKDSVS